MQLNKMTYQMCHEVLAAADVSAICKARGFSHSEGASRSTFENAFLSSTGLANAMTSLSPAEIAILHLLKENDEPVTIRFFDRLYPAAEKGYWVTITQQYRETLALVKKNLVRKGVLVMFEDREIEDSKQMERWRFVLPPAFTRYLPPLVANTYRSDQGGSAQDRLWVHKVREALGDTPVSAATGTGALQVRLEKGTLFLNGEPLNIENYQMWQELTWGSEFPERPTDAMQPDSFLPVDAAITILNSLAPGEWLTARQIEAPLKIFTHGKTLPSPAKLLHSGWKWGCLARLSVDGETYYRLAPPEPEPGEAFSEWLAPQGDALRVNFERVPLAVFLQLNQLANLSQVDNQFLARPDLVKLGKASPELRQSALVRWLSAQAPAFAQALEVMAQRWGKVILHHDLLVARVRDLSLRVQLERELKSQVVLLNSEFIAFPARLRADVERVLKKSGFVVKEVKA